MERIEADKLIWDFVTENFPKRKSYLPGDDWNYIMAAVEHIENGLPNNVKFKVDISLSHVRIHNLSNFPHDTKKNCPIDIISLEGKQDAVVSALAKWVLWYQKVYQYKCSLCGEKSSPDVDSGCGRAAEIGCNWNNEVKEIQQPKTRLR